MYRRKRHLRFTAVFLLVNFLQSIFLPPLANALTSGPTSPEATSFEPLDTTDMVNLQTGDFTYNVPLLDVPGPEGGYPISLSYHAGIKPLEDASWVGLGWNLNPGAVNRIVNGLPDDHKKVERMVHDFWEGGQTTSFSVGASYGTKGAGPNAGFDLTISNDTYRGFGGDVSLSGGYSLGPEKANLGAQGSISVGSSGFSAGVNIGLSNHAGSIGLQASTNFKGGNSIGLGISSKYGGISTGISLSSRGLKPSLSISGSSLLQQNDNFGKISTESGGFNVPIPIGLTGAFLNIGHRYTRYWMDETDEVKGYGTLYAKDASMDFVSTNSSNPNDGPVDRTFDSYALLDTSLDLTIHNDPDWVLGGSLPAYDTYQVLGQGITGTMRPHIYENGSLFREQKKVEGTPDPDMKINFLRLTDFTKRVNFRFDNDFSNHFLNTSQPDLDMTGLYNGSLINNQTTPSATGIGYNASDQHLAGSKHIEWFSNTDITSAIAKSKGFIDYSGTLNRTLIAGSTFSSLGDQIGGYSITNESGVTYHYALPVYNYDEYSRTESESNTNGDSYNEQFNPEPYAYTWLLTSITGPDFVDRGNPNGSGDGLAGEDDWGYWVNFDYGLWVDDYQWRTPSTGFTKQANSDIISFSRGRKQVYYLDAIQTRTHTALFIKDIRSDAKSVSSEDGGFEAGSTTFSHGPYQCYNSTEGTYDIIECVEDSEAFAPKALSSLKLDQVLLVKNSVIAQTAYSIDQIKTISAHLSYPKTFSNTVTKETIRTQGPPPGYPDRCVCNGFPSSYSVEYHKAENILDVYDIPLLQNGSGIDLTLEAIKTVEFETSYASSPETPNSLVNSSYYQAPAIHETQGKLTLEKLHFKGKNKAAYLPPLLFDYELENPATASFTTSALANDIEISISPSFGIFEDGDIIQHTASNGDQFYGLLTESDGNNNFILQSLGVNDFVASMSGNLQTTKNPPFHLNKYDYWGYYKSDFANGTIDANHLFRQPSYLSAKNTDVWSLRRITTSLGADIVVDYNNKEYNHIEMLTQNKFKIKEITKDPSYTGSNRLVKLEFVEEFDLTKVFSVGQTIPKVLAEVRVPPSEAPYYCEVPGPCQTGSATNIPVLSLAADHLMIELPSNFYDIDSDCDLQFPNHDWVIFNRGFICLPPSSSTGFGDGIRVASVQIKNALGQTESTTKYTYTNGTTSYLPFQSDMTASLWCSNQAEVPQELSELFLDYNQIFAKARELPAPGVQYEQSKIEEFAKDGSNMGARQYTFKTFDKEMIGFNYSNIVGGKIGDTNISQRTIALRDETAQVGNLLKVEEFNSLGQLANKTENYYAETSADYALYNNQGVIHQSFNEVQFKEDTYFRKAMVTTKKVFPSPLMSTVSTSANGTISTTYNREFDFYSGEATCTETVDQNGESYIAFSKPAYQSDWQIYGNIGPNSNPLFAGMGPKVNNPLNKNMLIQNTESMLYKSDGNGNILPGTTPLSATVTTWDNGWSYRTYNNSTNSYEDQYASNSNETIWRKHKNYVWKSDLNPDGTFVNDPTNTFDYVSPIATQDPHWQMVSKITRYDRYSKPLEEEDINSNTSAMKMGYDQSLILATCSNARYTEFAYSGAEDPIAGTDYCGGEVLVFGLDASTAHTGEQSAKANGSTAFEFKAKVGDDLELQTSTNDRSYRANVWIKGAIAAAELYYHYEDAAGNFLNYLPEGAVSGMNYELKAGDWHLLQIDFAITDPASLNQYLVIEAKGLPGGQDVWFDDFRFHPLDAQMSSYVYDTQTDELRFILDPFNLYMEFEYDAAGRLVKTYHETNETITGKRLLTKNTYNYGRDQ